MSSCERTASSVMLHLVDVDDDHRVGANRGAANLDEELGKRRVRLGSCVRPHREPES